MSVFKRKHGLSFGRPGWAAAALAAGLVLLLFGVWHDSGAGRRADRGFAPLTDLGGAPSASRDLKPAAVAGQFYPADAATLRADVDRFLDEARPPALTGVSRLIIVPHAGYEYSGQVAAEGFRALAAGDYRRVVIIGRSHRARFAGVAADDREAWQTPLGIFGVDLEYLAELTADSGVVRADRSSHDGEHSLEVMLPFLARTLGPQVAIVPLLFGDEDAAAARQLAASLARLDDGRTAYVISTDLSHYPSYEDANRLDAATVAAILTGDAATFRARLQEIAATAPAAAETLACADIAVESGLALAAALGLKPQLLRYANSGDVMPEVKDRVVGYAAIAFYAPAAAAPVGELDAAAQVEALAIARQTLENHFRGATDESPPAAAALLEPRGVFVTLKERGQLRGCIGVFGPDQPLYRSVRQMALAAAFEDNRFQPVDAAELPELEYEISVLSPLRRVWSPSLIEIGRHGVRLERDGAAGVFLPQVATEAGWDRTKFLSELCAQKAGLEPDCWRDPATVISVFTAQVFAEPRGAAVQKGVKK